MLVSEDKKHVNDLIESASNVAIVLPLNSTIDGLSSASALYQFVKEKNKDCAVIVETSADLIEKFKPFAKIQKEFGETTLVITLDYRDTQIEKVNYSTEGEVFKMRIFPVNKNFDKSKIKYDLEGPDFDLFIILGVKNLEELKDLYRDNLESFKRNPILNIDINSENVNFGTINIIEPDLKSLSQLIFTKMGSWGYVPNSKAVEALLLGIRESEKSGKI